MSERYKFEQFPWDESGVEFDGKAYNDLRFLVFLMVYGRYARKDGQNRPTGTYYKDVLTGDPAPSYSNYGIDIDSKAGGWSSDILQFSQGVSRGKFGFFGTMKGVDNSYTSPDDENQTRYAWEYSETGTKAYDGTRGDVFYASDSSVQSTADNDDYEDPFGPGSVILWYEESFSHSYSGVTNGKLILSYTNEKYHQLRPGTPLLLSSSNSAWNNRIVWVSGRLQNGTDLEVSLKDNRNNSLTPPSMSGSVSCDFGGTWWVLRQWKNAGWFIHDSTNPELNPNRPPAGGDRAMNSTEWGKAVNTCFYHHFDRNADRIVCRWDWDHGGQTVLPTGSAYRFNQENPSHAYLPQDVDWREQTYPRKYYDTERNEWIFKGAPEINAKHITDPNTLGAQHPQLHKWYQTASNAIYGSAWTDQYWKASWIGNTITTVHRSPVDAKGDGIEDNPRGDWEDSAKLSSLAIQNWVELAADMYGWSEPVDLSYKWNWLQEHWSGTCMHDDKDPKRTYGQVFGSDGSDGYISGWGAWNPDRNQYQQQYANLNDEYWGCHGSAFEFLLWKLRDTTSFHFDLYIDDGDTAWNPEDHLKANEVVEGENSYHGWSNPPEYDEATVSIRPTFEYSFGCVKNQPWKMIAHEQVTGVTPDLTLPSDTFGDGSNTGGDNWPQRWKEDDSSSSDGKTPVKDQCSDDFLTTTPSISFAASDSWSVTADGSNKVNISEAAISNAPEAGHQIWDETPTAYTVIKAEYADGGGVDLYFDKDMPSGSNTVYYNSYISSRHGANYGDTNQRGFWDNLLNILRECHDLLHLLKFKEIRASLENWNYELTRMEYWEGSSAEDVTNQWENYIQQNRPADPAEFREKGVKDTGNYPSTFWIAKEFGWSEVEYSDPKEYLGGVTNLWREHMFRLIIDEGWHSDRVPLPQNTVRCRLKMQASDNGDVPYYDQYDDDPLPCGYISPKVNVDGKTTVSLPIGSGYDIVYRYIDMEPMGDGTYEYVRIYLDHPVTVITCGTNPDDGVLFSRARIEADPNQEFLVEYQWNDYDLEIWDRTYELQDQNPQDPTTDTDPPQPTAGMYNTPKITDLNADYYNGDYGSPYSDQTYEPDWVLVMESYIMEDRGSPPVSYQYSEKFNDGPSRSWSTTIKFTHHFLDKDDVQYQIDNNNARSWQYQVKAKDTKGNTVSSNFYDVDWTDWDDAYSP
ncbi:hypothetical protein STSP2_03172 [Anaerohalosphaera lusitana]|uniref:Uncharacterized protein n=1 Tax=Anaerohalosphaera lusitana TaxID=1936003 RepID=A0A1U9NPW1_9BACT|nr:hypothetical protein [Anaerohalosphaera lusitana]AQT69972.1 hypothetical protein STSP2_03172 [Anaerohalosphaera lusitana]